MDSSLLLSEGKEKVALDTSRLDKEKIRGGVLFQCYSFSMKSIEIIIHVEGSLETENSGDDKKQLWNVGVC